MFLSSPLLYLHHIQLLLPHWHVQPPFPVQPPRLTGARRQSPPCWLVQPPFPVQPPRLTGARRQSPPRWLVQPPFPVQPPRLTGARRQSPPRWRSGDGWVSWAAGAGVAAPPCRTGVPPGPPPSTPSDLCFNFGEKSAGIISLHVCNL